MTLAEYNQREPDIEAYERRQEDAGEDEHDLHLHADYHTGTHA